MERIEWVASIGVAVAVVVTAIVMLAQHDRRRIQTRFAALLLALGSALILRALDAVSPWAPLTWLTFVAFAVFPLLAALFVESALPASLPLPLKLLLLAGVVGVPAAAAVPGVVHTPEFLSVVGAWQVLVFVGLLAFLGWSAAVTDDAARRATAGALLVGTLLAVLAIANDWAVSFGAPSKRFGAVLLLLLLFIVGEALFAEARFRLRRTLGTLAALLIGSLTAGGLVALVEAKPATAGVPTAVVVFFLAVAWLPVGSAVAHARTRDVDTLLLRLAALPVTSLEAFLTSLRGWPEIRTAVVVDAAGLLALRLDLLPRLLARGNVLTGVVEPADLRFLRAAATDPLVLRGAEQASHLLATHELDAILCVSDDGAAFGLGFTALVPGSTHRQAMVVAGAMVRLLLIGPSSTTAPAIAPASAKEPG